ncbi:MAG: formylmethanofuran--tetrahydromethanopterin N-formyltransferase [Candidatus Odinarchaeia archaeon]
MKLNGVEIEDAFAEVFQMWTARVIVTAYDVDALEKAIHSTTGVASSIIMCNCESGVDTFLKPQKTPDNRCGASLMFFSRDKKTLKHELLIRLSQCILTAPTTSVFNGLESDETTNIGYKISFFGDGWQYETKYDNRRVHVIPMMDGEFIIESKFGISEGIGGGNFLIMADTLANGLNAARKAVNTITTIPYVITPFPGGICRSGSKVGSKYRGLPASINHVYVPLLKNKVQETEVPNEVNTIYEIVINGLKLGDVKKAMTAGIEAATNCKGVIKITAANYGGKLGSNKISLSELF